MGQLSGDASEDDNVPVQPCQRSRAWRCICMRIFARPAAGGDSSHWVSSVIWSRCSDCRSASMGSPELRSAQRRGQAALQFLERQAAQRRVGAAAVEQPAASASPISSISIRRCISANWRAGLKSVATALWPTA